MDTRLALIAPARVSPDDKNEDEGYEFLEFSESSDAVPDEVEISSLPTLQAAGTAGTVETAGARLSTSR